MTVESIELFLKDERVDLVSKIQVKFQCHSPAFADASYLVYACPAADNPAAHTLHLCDPAQTDSRQRAAELAAMRTESASKSPLFDDLAEVAALDRSGHSPLAVARVVRESFSHSSLRVC